MSRDRGRCKSPRHVFQKGRSQTTSNRARRLHDSREGLRGCAGATRAWPTLPCRALPSHAAPLERLGLRPAGPWRARGGGTRAPGRNRHPRRRPAPVKACRSWPIPRSPSGPEPLGTTEGRDGVEVAPDRLLCAWETYPRCHLAVGQGFAARRSGNENLPRQQYPPAQIIGPVWT